MRVASTNRIHFGSASRLSSNRISTRASKGGSSSGFGKKPEPSKKSRRQVETEKKSQQFDDVVKGGGTAYAVFIRIQGKGPGPGGTNQWFPVGSIAVKGDGGVDKEIFNAEKPLLTAAFNMYPQLATKKNDPGLEYGYRKRDAKQMSEQEIRAGGDPFSNVVVAIRDAEEPSTNPILEAMSNFERWVVGGQ